MDASTRIEEGLILQLEKQFRRAARAYGKAAGKALRNGYSGEAAILNHLVKRISEPLASLEGASATLTECRDLSIWLPVPEEVRRMSLVERKGSFIGRIRRLKLEAEHQYSLTRLATQRPGRPPEGREVAVRAWELRMAGVSWADIERKLLPHRQTVTNPGRTINRQVQFLMATLKRYHVQFPRQSH